VSSAERSSDWPREDLEEARACPVCGHFERRLLHEALEDRVFRVAPGRWTLWRCESCGCAYLDPRPTRESVGRAYAELPSAPPPVEPTHSGLRHRVRNGYLNSRYGYGFAPASAGAGLLLWLFPKRRWNAELVVRHLPRDTHSPKLLDVGFGRGDFLLAMRDSGWDVHGIEPDADSVASARANGIAAEQGTLDDVPYAAESFDAITLSHVIEHLHDPVASLEACHRLLKPAGMLWAATPNIDSPGRRRLGRDWLGLDPPRHLVIFTRRALELAARQAGFDDVSFRRTYRAQLIIAASEEVRNGGEPLTVLRPRSRKSRMLGRALDTAAALRREWGEELIVTARKQAA
jgi:2-polyprenyl-3-methyl-5-hydroxy-6-metoxy-1,4-benzoquinol methylase